VIEYAALFASAFLAATLVPFYSEVAVAGLIALARPAALVLAVATAGNTLGAVVNWAIGWYLEHFRTRRWFPVTGDQLERAQGWFARYGQWSLLLAWMPIVGDALTFVAGMMRVRLVPFLILVGTGKALRYAAVIGAVDGALR
jgi:membrane protein YqaA with SNARE-associated domain